MKKSNCTGETDMQPLTSDRQAFSFLPMLFLLSLLLALPLAATAQMGLVGQMPRYPADLPVIEDHALLLVGEPEVTYHGEGAFTVRFETAVPTPPATLYIGVFAPDQRLAQPRYRGGVREEGDSLRSEHTIKGDFSGLMRPKYDIAQLSEQGGGVIAYRLEIYHPMWGTSRFYDRRFAFQDGHRVPCVSVGPFVDQVTDSSAILSWTSDLPAAWRLHLGEEVHAPELDEPVMRMELPLHGLAPDSLYEYSIHLQGLDGHKLVTPRTWSFHTAAEQPACFRFAVMGDSREGVGGGERNYGGVNGRALNRFMTDAYHRGADFIIHSGDLINGYTTSPLDYRMQLRAFQHAVEHVGRYLPIYEVMGNHEILMVRYDDGSRRGIRFDKPGPVNSESVFAEVFVNPTNGPDPMREGMPPYSENVYFFDHGNSRFVVMNNNYWWSDRAEEYGGNLEGYILDDQYHWLHKIFNDAAHDERIDHIFLFAQEAMFPNGGHVQDAMWYSGGAPEHNEGRDRTYVVQRRDAIWAAFAQTGKAVCGNFGDEHNYNRTLITPELNDDFAEPVWQLISGGAGAPFYNRNMNVPWADDVVTFSAQQNYTFFEVDGPEVTLRTYSFSGELIDEAVLVE